MYEGWGSSDERPIGRTTPDELERLHLPPGSMGPKVAAIVRFVRRGGGLGAVGSLADALAVAEGEAGTVCRVK